MLLYIKYNAVIHGATSHKCSSDIDGNKSCIVPSHNTDNFGKHSYDHSMISNFKFIGEEFSLQANLTNITATAMPTLHI